jgi:hypothetical protein
MDRLIKELESLAARQDVPTAQVVGAVMATAMRCRDILSARMVGLQALATATALQPRIDALQLQEDFLRILGAHYEPPNEVPDALQDIALAIKLAAAERPS